MAKRQKRARNSSEYERPRVNFQLAASEGPHQDSKERFDAFINKFIENDGRLMQTLGELGMSYQLFAYWERTQPLFSEAVRHTQRLLVEEAVYGIQNDLKHPDPQVRNEARKHVMKYYAHLFGIKTQDHNQGPQSPSGSSNVPPPVVNINFTPAVKPGTPDA